MPLLLMQHLRTCCAPELISNRPEAFLNEVILASETARLWLANSLSIFHRMSLFEKFRRGTVKAPKIWMVTGVQYVSGSRITDTVSNTLSNSISAAVPMPDPVAALTMIEAVKVKATKGGNEGS